MSSYLITGCSRGLGLALVQRLLSLPSSTVKTIFATARSEPPALEKLVSSADGRVVFIQLDVQTEDSIRAAVMQVGEKLAGQGLDVLINNAGMCNFTPNGVESMDDLSTHFNLNVQSVHNMTRAFTPLLRKGTEKKIINISTTVGSFAHAQSFKFAPTPAYKVSKAALNMLTVCYANDYEKEGFTVIALSPGWLKTDLGSDQADLTVEVGAEKTVDKILSAGKKDNGLFLNIHVPGWENAAIRYDGLNNGW